MPETVEEKQASRSIAPRTLEIVCPSCGSREVLFGSLVRWSSERRRWRVVLLDDEAYCGDCGDFFQVAETTDDPWQ